MTGAWWLLRKIFSASVGAQALGSSWGQGGLTVEIPVGWGSGIMAFLDELSLG